MCGIVGYIGHREAAPLILESLRKLEYRGYDSAGIAVLNDGEVAIRRCEGKLANLAEMLVRQPLAGAVGIGHTRWATHGRPSETNAHPHRAGDPQRHPRRHRRRGHPPAGHPGPAARGDPPGGRPAMRGFST